MSDPIGERLAAALGKSYDLQRLLGRGGMGSVYLARETALDRLVAIKVLPPEVAGDVESRERFRREARTAAKLTHPNIVPLYSFGEAEGLLWFVMGYVAGETLAAKLERTPQMDPDLTRRILADVADALDYAHGHKIVHRDVKPDNILIEDTTGKALLADFGVARAGTGGSTLTAAGMLVGTPLYMSPEQASGERDLDGRSDLYSLGVVGYRMLSGHTPFEGTELRVVLAAHITQPAPALPETAPEDLSRAIARALLKDPAERWASGRELRSALGAGAVVGEEEIERLGSLPSAGPTAAFLSAITLYAWFVITAQRPWTGFFDDVANMWLVMPFGQILGLIGVVVGAKLKLKRSWRETLRIAFWPPSWWSLPWPSAFRRPGDVWVRLPVEIRRLRWAVTVMFAALVGLIGDVIYEMRVATDQ